MSPRQNMSLEDTLLQLLFSFIVNTLYGAYLPRSYVVSDGLIIIIIIIIIIMIFVRGIYNYMPDTDHVSRVLSVAAVLYLQSVLHVMLFRPCSMYHTITLALLAVCVQCTIWLFVVLPLYSTLLVCCSDID